MMRRCVLTFPLASWLWLVMWGCSTGGVPAVPGEPPGSGHEQHLPLTISNVGLDVAVSWDRTGVVENSDSLGVFSLENNRLFLRWWEDARSDYFAFIQDQTTGDTLKVLFEGSPRKGLTELSFNVSALSVGRPHRWHLTRQAERDTLQLMDFQFLSE